MKILKTLLLTLALAPAAFAAPAEQGTRGGGDIVALEFKVASQRLLKLFRENDSLRKLVPELDVEAYAAAVEQVQVESEEKLFLDRREVDAINYPMEKRIEVNRTRWLIDKTSSTARMALVAHEFLGILNKDDANYQLSHKISQWFYDNGTGDLVCSVEGGFERRRTDPGVQLIRNESINATVYDVIVDGSMVMQLAHFRDDEMFDINYFDPDTKRSLGGGGSNFPRGGYGYALYVTPEKRQVFIGCNAR